MLAKGQLVAATYHHEDPVTALGVVLRLQALAEPYAVEITLCHGSPIRVNVRIALGEPGEPNEGEMGLARELHRRALEAGCRP